MLSQNCKKRLLASSSLSVRPSTWNNSAPNGRIFVKFDFWVFFENMLRKFKIHQNLTKITGSLHEGECTFIIISRLILLRMRNVSEEKCYRENEKSFCVQLIHFRKSCRLWNNMGKYFTTGETTDNVPRHIRIACWIPKAINTHSEYVTFLVHFNNGYTNVLQWYVLRTLSVLLFHWLQGPTRA